MEVPSDLPWELLIVNNNSTDQTDDVVGEYVGACRYGGSLNPEVASLRSRATGYWIPEAIVEHRIGSYRQTVRYIADFYESWGGTLAFLNAATTVSAPFWFGIPRRIWPSGRGWTCGGCAVPLLPPRVSGARLSQIFRALFVE
jgi:hypothetical protein